MTRKVFAPNDHIRDNSGNTLYYGIVANESIRQSAVTVVQIAILLPAVPLSKRKYVTIFNNSSNVIYIGDLSVTTSDGFPLYPRAQISIAIEDDIDIYGISSTGNNDVRVFEGA